MGLGTVGSGVFEILHKNPEQIARRAGGPIEITRILVRDANKARRVPVAPERVTTEASQLLDDPQIHIIVELDRLSRRQRRAGAYLHR